MNRVRIKKCKCCDEKIKWKPVNKNNKHSIHSEVHSFDRNISYAKLISEDELSVTYTFYCKSCDRENIATISKKTYKEIRLTVC
ncbi:hypothetical protein SAMN02745751_03124 [Dethiosulfatibacter aminovorans DSM 17477]|uniref:Uncharacterized protein n=1 Tax=Dethiosulfatibacter aminovorans DSM 17477 TaxID=1121476 RepID=A0A1M6LB50_9FIRM|nr:hypothetical protein [Dethiosulfatibacter aminovorans]SHJ68450.1 hypothetical protein SAMN02745751_03124 [Dethiosulfatibacter aminovorans DSM 17477]